jgi:hypothetical protein
VNNNNTKFKNHELWYIAYSLFSVLKELKKLKISFGGLKSDQIYITPQGEIKIYPNSFRRSNLIINNLDNSHAGIFKIIRELTQMH